MGIVWDKNELSSSANDIIDTGLTLEGVKMVSRMAELGIILDVSHLSDRAFYEAFELSPMPHIATHSNFRAVCDHDRNLTDEMARMIAARGGVMGLNLYPSFLREDGYADTDDILRQVDYGLSLVGDSALAFGFDIDGTDGQYPFGIDTSRSMHEAVIELLLSRYPASTVEKIAGGNVIEFLKDNLVS
jgi:membrane dipeptidase